MKLCSIEGCEHVATRPNDWCHTHYDRYLRTGDPTKGGKDDTWHLIKQELPGEAKEIAERLGLSHAVVTVWMTKMRNATPRQVYISKWRRPEGKGRHVATYALGDKPDVVCDLERLPREVTYQRYREKLVKTWRIDTIRARQLARYYVGRAKSRKATWASALGVRA